MKNQPTQYKFYGHTDGRLVDVSSVRPKDFETYENNREIWAPNWKAAELKFRADLKIEGWRQLW